MYVVGVYIAPLIGVITLDPVADVVQVVIGIEEKWYTWIDKHRTITEKGM